jgi:hypothetical protein
MQNEEDRGDQFTLSHPSPHDSTGVKSSQCLYGEESSWKVVWAKRKEGQGGGIDSTQQAVEVNGPFRCHWWECVGGNQC